MPLTTLSDCYEIIDGVCLLEDTPTSEELEEFMKATNIESRFILVQEEDPCPSGYKRGSKGNCRKISRYFLELISLF